MNVVRYSVVDPSTDVCTEVYNVSQPCAAWLLGGDLQQRSCGERGYSRIMELGVVASHPKYMANPWGSPCANMVAYGNMGYYTK